LPSATVLTLHPNAAESARHSRLLAGMKIPGNLELSEVITAGTWGEGQDLSRLADTLTVVDVQLIIGPQRNSSILRPHVLRAVLSLARWTLISIPLEAMDDVEGDPLHKAMELKQQGLHDPVRQLKAETSVLGLVRVPATQDMQALFLVGTQFVERHSMGTWHPLLPERFSVLFGAGINATMSNRQGQGEVAGVLLETLLGLGLPLGDRTALMAHALRDVQPGPADWVVCCGGIWQWCGHPNCNMLHEGSLGVFTSLTCAFGLAPRALELIAHSCVQCAACDQQPLQAASLACEACGLCILNIKSLYTLAPIPVTKTSAVVKPSQATPLIGGFSGPLADDVPGPGDLGNCQVPWIDECARMCRENPRCQSFEYSPTATLDAAIRNCQLTSSQSRGGAQYNDFMLYFKRGLPGSVDEALSIIFTHSQGTDAALDGSAGSFEINVEAGTLVDGGSEFGVRQEVGIPYGWFCAKGPSGLPVVMPRVQASYPGFCPGGAVWQINVPHGMYSIEVHVDDSSSSSSCKVQGIPLLSGPPTPLSAPAGAAPATPAQQDANGVPFAPSARNGTTTPILEVSMNSAARLAAKASADAAAEAKEVNDYAAALAKSWGIATTSPPTSKPTVPPHRLWANTIQVTDGSLRFTECATAMTQLRRVEIHRTWRQCQLPVAPSKNTVTSTTAAPVGP